LPLVNGKMRCACTDCLGATYLAPKKVLEHITHPKKGRAPACWIWRGPHQDSSDEEWAKDYIPQLAAQATQRANLAKCTPRVNIANDAQAEVNAGFDKAVETLDDPRILTAIDELGDTGNTDEPTPAPQDGSEPFDFDDMFDRTEGVRVEGEDLDPQPFPPTQDGSDHMDPMLAHL
jgi:hypothetical protein